MKSGSKHLLFLAVAISMLSSATLGWGVIPDAEALEHLPNVDREIIIAKDLAFNSWNLTKIRAAYEAALSDLGKSEQIRTQLGSDDVAWITRGLQQDLEIVNWEIEGAAARNVNDPRGLENVVSHLNERYRHAVTLQEKGDRAGAQTEFTMCYDSWIALQDMHPKWKGALVWEQIQMCSQKLILLRPPEKYRYADPKFGTPLSV